ncbi:MAG: polymerase subunit alpha, partial [Actinomycetota bacterium]|nr:polymerase subunit alpha [Actinomycetota bacterium]
MADERTAARGGAERGRPRRHAQRRPVPETAGQASPHGRGIPLSGIVDSKHERYGEAAEVRALVETDEECKTIFETARGLEGLIRNAGVHACAVIMSCDPLTDAIPLWQRDDGSIIT